MGKFLIGRFKKGKWLSKSNSLLSDKAKLTQMLHMLPRYMSKGGLKRVKEDLLLLCDYVRDILRGDYKDYSVMALTLAVAALLYVVSPMDVVPDWIPAGLLDDASIVAWAISQLSAEMEKYQTARKPSAE